MLFAAAVALPYGAAAALMRPLLVVVAGGEPLPADLDPPAQRSVIFASDGTRLATLSGVENRVTVDLSGVPKRVRHAVLAVEDADFYDHAGVNHRAIVRALFANLRAGGVVQGGSTITQQYIKNAVLSPERSIERKATEMRYAIDLERRLDKDEILERYLNISYFGEGIYGIATAAEYYYSKTLDELTLDEAALLAGLISEPERANPATDPAAAAARRDVVLQRMQAEGFATAEEVRSAQRSPVEFQLSPLPPPNNPFFVEHVKQILFDDDALGATRDERQQAVFGGGLHIHTTLDPALQTAARDAIAEVLTDPTAHPMSTLVSVDPATGALRALAVGPKGFGPCDTGDEPCATTQVNPAVDGLGGSGRQPGSAFKPVVAASALTEGMPPGWEEITDSGQTIPGCDGYAPENFDPSDGGVKDMYEAIAVSSNVYHAKLMGRLQPGPVVEMAKLLGFPDRDLPRECSLALGTATVFPLDMAVAFATIASGGTRCAPYAVQRIVRGDEVLREYDPDCTSALDNAVAVRLIDLLRGPVEDGTATAAQLDRPVAGKTGTTDGFRDAWFTGFVPQLVTAAWVGFEEPRPLANILGVEQVTGGSIPARLWATFMRAAVADMEVATFPEAPPLERLTIPDAVGTPVDELTDRLGEYDFHVLTEEVTDFYPPGTVVAQQPDPGTRAAAGAILRLQLSDGTGEPPQVPDVVGLGEQEARAALEGAGYRIRVRVEERSATIAPGDDPADLDPPDGAVTAQQPSPGSRLRPQETVTVTVVRYDITREERPPSPRPEPSPPRPSRPEPSEPSGPVPTPAEPTPAVPRS